MDFIELISKKLDSKYKETKLVEVKLNNTQKTITMKLIFPDAWGRINNEEQAKILELAKSFVDEKDYEVNLEYKRSYVDERVLSKAVLDIIGKTNRGLASLLDEKDIAMAIDNNNFRVAIAVYPSMLGALQVQGYTSSLVDELSVMFCGSFELDFVPTKKEKSIDDVLKENDNGKSQLALLRDTATFIKDEHFEIVLKDSIFGNISDTIAIRLDMIKTPMQKAVIAGRVKFFSERKFIAKRGEDEGKEKTYYNFTIEDQWNSLGCVLFPTKETAEKIKNLKDDLEVVVSGEIQHFNDKFSLKVKSVALCEIPKVEEKIEYRKEFDEYIKVFPQKYVEHEQMSLLNLNTQNTPCQYLLENDIVVFDFETTGLNPDSCELIEIGAVKLVKGVITETFSSLMKPSESIPKEVVEITSITDEMVKDAPSYELVLADFYKFTRGCVLSAYNIEFDAKFLSNYSKKILFKFDNKQIDTLELARKKIKGLTNYKLKTVVEALGVSLESAHRALDDAIATAKVFIKLC